jgi:hypothetical protein
VYLISEFLCSMWTIFAFLNIKCAQNNACLNLCVRLEQTLLSRDIFLQNIIYCPRFCFALRNLIGLNKVRSFIWLDWLRFTGLHYRPKAFNMSKPGANPTYDIWIYNYVQRQRCSRLVRFFKAEEIFLFLKSTRLLLAL